MGLFAGILSHDWKTIKSQNSFALKYWPLKWYYNSKSRVNDKYFKMEEEKFARAINAVTLKKDPIFILGHWRSGTTMLHNTLCRDEQFAYPNLFETYNPHTFLTLYPKIQADKKHQQDIKRPMDNVHVNYKSPAEDEFALSLLSLCSPVIGWAFPQQREYYDRYLLLDNVSLADMQRWQWALTHLVKKLTFKYDKPIILKSPQHTARIGKILQLFPNAKFIHFRRNPYDVYSSTLKLYTNTVRSLAFQSFPGNGIDDYIIKAYKIIYQRFATEKELIPESNFCEVAYEDFIADIDAGLRHIYSSLGLDGVENLIATIKSDGSKKSKYKRNTYAQLDASTKKKINSEWQQYFYEWNYTLN